MKKFRKEVGTSFETKVGSKITFVCFGLLDTPYFACDSQFEARSVYDNIELLKKQTLSYLRESCKAGLGEALMQPHPAPLKKN